MEVDPIPGFLNLSICLHYREVRASWVANRSGAASYWQTVNQLELLIDSTDEGPLIAKIRETVNKVIGKANYKSKSSGQSESTPRSGSPTQGADNRSTQGNLKGYL